MLSKPWQYVRIILHVRTEGLKNNALLQPPTAISKNSIISSITISFVQLAWCIVADAYVTWLVLRKPYKTVPMLILPSAPVLALSTAQYMANVCRSLNYVLKQKHYSITLCWSLFWLVLNTYSVNDGSSRFGSSTVCVVGLGSAGLVSSALRGLFTATFVFSANKTSGTW